MEIDGSGILLAMPSCGVMKQYGMDVDCLVYHQQSGYRGGQAVEKTPTGIDKNGFVIQSNGARLASLMTGGAKAGGDYKKLELSYIAAKSMEGLELRTGKPRPDNCNFLPVFLHKPRKKQVG